jgi:hypothetical protein
MDHIAPAVEPNDPPLRDRFNAFVARHDIAWELGMGALAIVFVALGFLIDEAGPGTKPKLELVELAITVVFVAEFVSRILAAHDRAQYLRGHWIDVVALAPPLREARLLRCFGFFASCGPSPASTAPRCTFRVSRAIGASPGWWSPGSP